MEEKMEVHTAWIKYLKYLRYLLFFFIAQLKRLLCPKITPHQCTPTSDLHIYTFVQFTKKSNRAFMQICTVMSLDINTPKPRLPDIKQLPVLTHKNDYNKILLLLEIKRRSSGSKHAL